MDQEKKNGSIQAVNIYLYSPPRAADTIVVVVYKEFCIYQYEKQCCRLLVKHSQ